MATEKELAICQMNVLNTVLFGGGMDIGQALNELGLISKNYLIIAREEGIEWVANEIEKQITSH